MNVKRWKSIKNDCFSVFCCENNRSTYTVNNVVQHANWTQMFLAFASLNEPDNKYLFARIFVLTGVRSVFHSYIVNSNTEEFLINFVSSSFIANFVAFPFSQHREIVLNKRYQSRNSKHLKHSRRISVILVVNRPAERTILHRNESETGILHATISIMW